MATSISSIISSIGVGSGLPLDKLLADMRTVESQPLTLIKSRYDATQSRISAYATLRNAVETVRAAAQAFTSDNALGALKATTTGDAFTATATGSAVTGEYQVHVRELATAQTLVSRGMSERNAMVSEGGVITFTFGNGEQTKLDLKGESVTLEALAAAINQDSKLGVRATFVNDGSDTPHRLLLTAAETGTDAAVTRISVSGNTDPDNRLQALIGFDAGQPSPMQERVAAANAAVEINGIAVTSQSNRIPHAIEGVTLQLTQAGSAQTLKITRDDSGGIAAVRGFVTAYNALQSTLSSLTGFDTDNGTSSSLTGDSVARRVQSMMRDTLAVGLAEGNVRSLAQLGIGTNPTNGNLELDETRLSEALADNLSDVKALLTGENGLLRRITDTVNAITGDEGMISVATEGAERSAKLLDDEYTATSERIEQRMETYRQQFIALDKTVAQMSSISSYLTQQLAMLSNLNSASDKS